MTSTRRRRAADFLQIETVVPHRFRTLDGYRAIAVLAVVTTHVAYFSGIVVITAWGHMFARMDIGVTIFFLLSGFLLYRPWSRRRCTTAAGPRPARTSGGDCGASCPPTWCWWWSCWRSCPASRSFPSTGSHI
ncbi:MAG: acyltransferase [Micrococcales bacterium]|nr:acyltransferase [Micrococcales bacterium]